MALVEIRDVLDTLDKNTVYQGYLQDFKGWCGVEYKYIAGEHNAWRLEQLESPWGSLSLHKRVDTLGTAQRRIWRSVNYSGGFSRLPLMELEEDFLARRNPVLIEVECLPMPITEEMYF